MFNNELMADVHFIVGALGVARRVPAHKVGKGRSPFPWWAWLGVSPWALFTAL